MSAFEFLHSSTSIHVEEKTVISINVSPVSGNPESMVIAIDTKTATEDGSRVYGHASFSLFLPTDRVAEVIDLLIEAAK